MYWLNGKQFEELAEQQGGVCVSMYMPTARKGPDTIQGPKRLRNILGDAEDRLIASGLRRPIAKQLLEPAAQLMDNSDFWQHQAEALAIFLSPGRQWMYHLPYKVEELITVSDRFHVTPLLPLLNEGGRFYFLALSGNRVRLLRCTRDAAAGIEVPGMPRSFEELDKYIDDAERQLQLRTAPVSGAGGGGRAAMFHGHGQAADDRQLKKWLNDYCHMVEHAVTSSLEGETAPLLLAAAEPIQSIYRGCNTYPHLLKEPLPGCTDDQPDRQLHDGAWPVVRPYFEQVVDRVRRTLATPPARTPPPTSRATSSSPPRTVASASS